jgi:hypothetical protein
VTREQMRFIKNIAAKSNDQMGIYMETKDLIAFFHGKRKIVRRCVQKTVLIFWKREKIIVYQVTAKNSRLRAPNKYFCLLPPSVPTWKL